MASKRAAFSLSGASSHLASSLTRDPLMVAFSQQTCNRTSQHLQQCLLPRLPSRNMATETTHPTTSALSGTSLTTGLPPPPPPLRRPPPPIPQILTTIYSFPSLEPLSFTHYPATHLDLPLRRDILHRAIIYEADGTRLGTASTKWRSQVHGSGRKLRPQKGTGRARVGDKKSPTRRGGGVAHGPHPRDFSTDLPRKIYDLAWRTALSYRYRKGELLVLDRIHDLQPVPAGSGGQRQWVEEVYDKLQFGRRFGSSMLVTRTARPNLFEAFTCVGSEGTVKEVADVDVKNLLEKGRIVIERSALEWIFREHCKDVDRVVPSAVGV